MFIRVGEGGLWRFREGDQRLVRRVKVSLNYKIMDAHNITDFSGIAKVQTFFTTPFEIVADKNVRHVRI